MSERQRYIIALCLLNRNNQNYKIDSQLPTEYFICEQSNLGEDLTFLMDRHSTNNHLSYIKILKPNDALNHFINERYEYNDEIRFNAIKNIHTNVILKNAETWLFVGGPLGLNSNIYNESNFKEALGESAALFEEAINNLRHIIFANVKKYADAFINSDVETMAGEHIASEYKNAIKYADSLVQNAMKDKNFLDKGYSIILNTYIKVMEDTDAKLKKHLENNKEEYINVVNEYVEIKNTFIRSIESIKRDLAKKEKQKKLGDSSEVFLHNNQRANNSSILQEDNLGNNKQYYVGLLYYYTDDDPNNLKITYFICDSSNFRNNFSFWINRYQNNTENLSYIKILKPDSNLNQLIKNKLKEAQDSNVKEFDLLKEIKLENIENHSVLLFFTGGSLGVNKMIFNQNQFGEELSKFDNENQGLFVEEETLIKDMSHYLTEILSDHDDQEQSTNIIPDKRKMSESNTSTYLDINSKSCSKLTDDNTEDDDEDDEDEGSQGKEGLKP